MELGPENPHFRHQKYRKMQYFTNNGPETPKTDVNHISACFYKPLGSFDTIYIQQYQNRMVLGSENAHFRPAKYLKMQYFSIIAWSG